MGEKIDFFHDKIRDLNDEGNVLKSLFNKYSIYRIAVFFIFLVVALWSLNANALLPLIIISITCLVTFIFLVKKHNQIRNSRNLNGTLVEINREEVHRLKFEFDGIDGGDEFIDEKHPYSHDLDLFGKNSLFKLINRASTYRGRNLVSGWLKKPAIIHEIEKRQKASMELQSMLEWRQNIQAYGKIRKDLGESHFFSWLSGEDRLRKWQSKFLPVVSTLVFLCILMAFILDFISIYIFLNSILLQVIICGLFLYSILDYSKDTYEKSQVGVYLLQSIKRMIILVEGAEFQDEFLIEIQGSLKQNNVVASEKIEELRKIFDWLNLRGNQIYLILNSVFLLDFILLARAELWRAKYKKEIENWFETISKIEALNSLAAFSFANDDYVFPEVVNQPFYFRSKHLGHPLIPAKQRINNDFGIDGQGNSCIITGSNMAGKSTFLRTVGVNAVLAFAGAPVCATSLHLSLFQVFSSMRTKDNLEENISSFYAELLRLKMLLEAINDKMPTFYLLDEILKGTNSTDRHLGAESLILQLNKLNAFGLVSTHDLELGKLSKSNKKIKNYNFNSSIVGEEIVFDYKLCEGICESTNASQLMAKIGIKISS